jgi:hypothetical protein
LRHSTFARTWPLKRGNISNQSVEIGKPLSSNEKHWIEKAWHHEDLDDLDALMISKNYLYEVSLCRFSTFVMPIHHQERTGTKVNEVIFPILSSFL